MNEKYYKTTPEGTFLVEKQITRLELTSAVMERMSSTVVRRIGLHTMCKDKDYGGIGLTVGQNDNCFWSVRVAALNMETHFGTEDETFVPIFHNAVLPVLKMKWMPPDDMRLIFMLHVNHDGYQYRCENQYLVAVDESGRMWRLPLSNLYADCKVCHGIDTQKHNTARGPLTEALTAFSRSQWNDHLYKDTDSLWKDKTRRLFRFVSKGTEFVQTSPLGGVHWSHCAEKVANDFLTKHTIIHLPLPE